MQPHSRRRSFNEAAGGSDEPPKPSFACSAHGCPIAGSITTDGRRVCFVHYGVEPMRLWDGATARIRNRMRMVQAVEILRNPGFRTEAMALEEARQLVPNLAQEHDTRYKAQFAIETRLIAIAKGAGDDDGDGLPIPPAPAQGPNVVDMVRRLASDHRMPGGGPRIQDEAEALDDELQRVARHSRPA